MTKLGKTQRKLLDFLTTNSRQMETSEIQIALGFSADKTLNGLRRLFKNGLVMRVAYGKEFRWIITPASLITPRA